MKISDNNVYNLLGQAGLSDSEKILYLQGRDSGPITSAKLVKITAMPRPTVTGGLKVLVDVGLCQTSRLDGRTYVYTMLPPSSLKMSIAERIRSLDKLMEDLEEYSVEHVQPLINQANGIEESQALLEQALRCKNRNWKIIASKENAITSMPKSYQQYFKKVRNDRQIESQTIWESGSKTSIPLKDILMRKPRYVPSEIKASIPSLMVSFDQSILIISGKGSNINSVIIKDRSITETFNLLFEMAWRVAEKP